MFRAVYEEMSIDECMYVYDVLDMYRVLIRSYEALADKDALTFGDVKIIGFDGNNEGKWAETLAGYLNSHSMRTMSLYPQMLEISNLFMRKL